jgi:hypothetical protein
VTASVPLLFLDVKFSSEQMIAFLHRLPRGDVELKDDIFPVCAVVMIVGDVEAVFRLNYAIDVRLLRVDQVPVLLVLIELFAAD